MSEPYMLPADVMSSLTEYIEEPSDFFAIKSTCSYLHSISPPVFSFTTVRQICVASRSLSGCKIPISSRIRYTGRLDAAFILELLDKSVDMELVASLIQGISSGQLRVVIVLAPRSACLLFAACCSSRNLSIATRLMCEIEKCRLFALDPIPALISLHSVASYGSDQLLNYMLTRHPLTFSRQIASSVINLVVRRGMALSFRKLVEMGVDLNRSYGGEYPIQAAVKTSNFAMLLLLLTCGARPAVRYRSGQTQPIHLAVDAGNTAMVEVLLKYGADVQKKDFFGRTPTQIIAHMITKAERRLRGASDHTCELPKLRKIQALLSFSPIH
jgi:hypothetical protein